MAIAAIFDTLAYAKKRSSVVKAFKKYMEDATKVLCVMKKLREFAEVV